MYIHENVFNTQIYLHVSIPVSGGPNCICPTPVVMVAIEVGGAGDILAVRSGWEEEGPGAGGGGPTIPPPPLLPVTPLEGGGGPDDKLVEGGGALEGGGGCW